MGAWAIAIPAVIGVASAAYGAISGKNQNDYQQAVNSYNAQMGYRSDLANIAASSLLNQVNMNMVLSSGRFDAEMARWNAEFNSMLITETLEYNDSLFEAELRDLWDSIGLDLQLLESQRSREKGEIIADQASSGVVIGEGSAADIIIDQKTQEALDVLVIRHGAEIQAAKISNARAQSLWEGNLQVRRVIWEGETNAMVSLANATMTASGLAAQGGIEAITRRKSADYSLLSAATGATYQYSANKTQIQNNLMSGLFNTAGQAASSYFSSKPVSTYQSSSGYTPQQTTPQRSPSSGYTFNTGYTHQYPQLTSGLN